MPPHRNAYRPAIGGRRGAVTSAHPLATLAGMQMLLAGGNAVDAAVAVASSLNVVEPYMSGIGGIGLMIVYSARERKRYLLDFVGRAPQSANPDDATQDQLDHGPRSCVTPGTLGCWLAAHERFGTMPRANLFAPAIRMAAEGVPLTWKNCEFINLARAELLRMPEAARIFLGDGDPQPGKLLVQTDLAETYRLVAEGGAETFYRGPLAQRISAAVQSAGGWLDCDDLAAFKPEWREPLTMRWQEYDFYSVPPPFVSFQTYETLNILEHDDLAGWGHNSVDYLHHLIEAMKLAVADRLAYGYSGDVPVAGLLSKAYAAAQRQRIAPDCAGVSEGERFNPQALPGQLAAGEAARFGKEHTTHFACADSEGNVVTVTQTLGTFFAGMIVPGTGIMLNNILQWLDLDPASAYRLAPGRKPSNNMSPMQVSRDGEVHLSIGTPGSYGILQTTAQMALNVLVFGQNIQEAIEAPRIRTGRGRRVDVEGRLPAEVRAGLERRGHEVHALDDWSWAVGGGQGITRDPATGAWLAGADPRRDGYALAW